jgi:hypothetical protein
MAPSSSPSAAPPQPSSDNPPPTSPPPPHPQPSILRLPPSPCRLPPPSRLEMPSRTGFTSVLPPRRMPLRGAGRSLLSRSSMTKVKPRQWRLLRFHPSMWWDLAAAPGSRRSRGVVAVDSWPTRTAQLATSLRAAKGGATPAVAGKAGVRWVSGCCPPPHLAPGRSPITSASTPSPGVG